MIILDASAAADACLRLEPESSWVRGRLAEPDESLHAPHLIDVEVMGAIRKSILSGIVPEARGRQAFEAFCAMRIKRYVHAAFLERAWQLRANLTASDAMYVALAEALDAPLVTTDERLGRAPGHRARVQAFPAV